MSSLIQAARSAMSVVFGILRSNSEDYGDFFQIPANFYQPHKEFEKLIPWAIHPLSFSIEREPTRLEAVDVNRVLFLLKMESESGLKEFNVQGFFRVYKILLADSNERSGREIPDGIYLSHFQTSGRIHQVPYTPALKRVCVLIRRLMGLDLSEADIFPDYAPEEIRFITGHLNRMGFNEVYPREKAISDYRIINNWPSILPARR